MGSSQFRDTFSKEQRQEPLLAYDDSAFLFFAATIVIMLLVPIIIFEIYGIWNQKKKKPEQLTDSKKHCSCNRCLARFKQLTSKEYKQTRFSFKLIRRVILTILMVILGMLFYCIHKMPEPIQSFDPFAILELSQLDSNISSLLSAVKDDKERTKIIKKQYRSLSLKYHPDRNLNDPGAHARFLLINKAYQALTDPVSRKNYELYGNPDGPGTMKIGIGLPKFLISEEYHVYILIWFFLVLLVLIPIIFYQIFKRFARKSANGTLYGTLRFLYNVLHETKKIRDFVEIFAASEEAREIPTIMADGPSEQTCLKEIESVFSDVKTVTYPNITLNRNYCVILCHLHRRHDLLTPGLANALTTILNSFPHISRSLIEMALLKEFTHIAEEAIEFNRQMIQAIEKKGNSLLQIPHFNENIAKKCTRGKKPLKGFSEFMTLPIELLKGLEDLSEDQLDDIKKFKTSVHPVEIEECTFCVEDEEQIVVGDIITVNVTLRRIGMDTDECSGYIHAPYFPLNKEEKIWIILKEKDSSKLITWACKSIPRHVQTINLKFQPSHSGKMSITVLAKSDSFIGLDAYHNTSIHVKSETQVKREVVIHQEDLDLDKEPTLFQQMLQTQSEAVNTSDDDEVFEVNPRTGVLKKVGEIPGGKSEMKEEVK